MVQRPAWLTRSTMTMVAVLLFAACAGPAATPTPGPTTAPTNPPTATGTPGQSSTPSAAPSSTAEASPSAAPTGTPYPSANEQPGDPTAITDSYPNYGGDVDCANGTFNGLPYTGNVKKISAPDPMTVVFDLCNADVAFLSKMAFSVFAINDSDYLIQHAAAGDLSASMNGTGPYKFVQWQRGTEIDFARNDNYWGDKAASATGVLQWNKDATARLQALQAGTVDGITLVDPGDWATVQGDSSLSLDAAPGLNTLYLGMNHDDQPWSNPLVRQAMAVAIDRQRLVDNFYPTGSIVADHFTPCDIKFACGGDAWPATDTAKAKDLLTQAGFPNGFTTTLSYRNVNRGYLPKPVDVATDIQAQLAAIGITVTLDEQESGTFIANANTGQLTGLFLLGWGADYPDVTNFLDYHFGAGCTAAFGQCYPDIFGPLKIGATSGADADRAAAYADANNAILQEVPMVPLAHGSFANAYKAGIGDQQISPISDELVYRLVPETGKDQVVFMQNAEPIGLYCADETDGESLRACLQSMESLYQLKENGSEPIPALATSCVANADATQWTCTLRPNVTFHNGATFEAKDVIVSFAAQWDALSPIHKGNTGTFEYWPGLWGGFLNPPAPCGISGQPACAAP